MKARAKKQNKFIYAFQTSNSILSHLRKREVFWTGQKDLWPIYLGPIQSKAQIPRFATLVATHPFPAKPVLNLVQQNQFSGSPTKDPNLHISTFLRLSGTLKENQEVVRLHLFPFSLRGRASAWFHSLEVGSIT